MSYSYMKKLILIKEPKIDKSINLITRAVFTRQ